jgi:murein DD-endopeptidase MepM/ murein hydrolase activator NlpD
MTEQEMQAVFEKLQRGVELTSEEMIALARNAGYMSGQFKRLETSVNDFAKDLKKAGDELPSALLKSAGNTTKSLGGLAKGLGEAETGFRQLTPIIDAAAAAFSTVPVLGGVVRAAAEAGKFMINQLQNATDAFQDIAKVGGLTATGMSGLQQQFLDSGMQLKSYTKTIAANSAALANFAGSVGAGADQFSRTAGMVQKQFGQGLQRLGYGIDEIGETTASYIARQTRMGLAQGKSSEVLAAGAAKYAIELDELSKLTGASKEELKKQQDAALSESRFRGKIEEMRMNGQAEQAEKLIAAQAALAKQSPALGRAFRDSVSGFIGTSKESIAGYQSLGGEMSGLVDTAMTGSISDVTNFSKDAMKRMMPMFAQFAQLGIDIGIPFSEMADAANGVTKSSKDLQTVQDKQMTAPDKLTQETVSAQRNMQELSIQIQKLGFTYMPAAASAVNTFTGALNKLLKTVAKEVGGPDVNINGSAAAPGGGRSGQSPAQKAAAKRQAVIDQRRQEAENAALSGQATVDAPLSATPALGAGPAFSRPDDTRADKVQLTLTEIRDEIKKLVAVGGVPGGAASGSGQAQVQAALTEHDHAHPHPPSADVSPELAAKIGTLVAPLEKMNQTSGFIRNDGKTMHGAVDLAGKIGDKVMAPISGVAKVLSDPKGYGNYVEVTDTITGVKHILAHLDKTMVKTGDVIKAGTQIGTVGNTGMSTGAHLHHEIKLPDGTRVDPSKFYAGAAGRGRAPGAPAMAGAPGDLGSLSQKYESGAAGSMAVGRDRSGGTSYGKYQIASKVGSMDAFLKLLQKNDPEAHARLMAAGPQDAGTEGKFAQEWKKLAGEGKIQKSEREFAVDKIFQPAMKGIKDQDLSKMIGGNKGLQEMMFSMAIQHGGAGAPAILNKVFKKGMTPQQLTEASYAERGADGGQRYFGKSSEGERAGVVSRFGREKQDVLAMLGMPGAAPGVPGAPTATALATPQAPAVAPAYTAANAGLAGQGQNVISTGLSAITTALFGGGAQGAPGTAESGVGGSEAVSLLQQLVILSRDQNSNLSKILSASTA